ncbi:MAG: WD40 repeat domain-containing protein [Phycisphaerae bacterium]|nr:WD40 repeat domain-containing protein [Saprospiraceae bacterium]
MIKKVAFLVHLILVLGAYSGFAQSCYETIRNKGIQLMDRTQYGAAISQFWVAMTTCPDKPDNHDLQELITRAQNAQISALQVIIQEKNTLYNEAVQARDEASEAREKEETAKEEAERNALFAREQGRRAESLRLALLSDILRTKGLRSDAVTLAYIALKISPSDSATVMQRSFGDAVRDSFQTTVYSGQKSAQDAFFLPPSNNLLIRTKEQSIIFRSATGSKTELVPTGGQNLGVVISHSGTYFLTWADNQSVQVWNTEGRRVATLSGHSEPVRFAAFSSDDTRIITCSRDNTARIWGTDGALQAVCSGHTGNVYDGGFLSGGKQIFTRSSDGTVRIWNSSGDIEATLNESGIYTYTARPDITGNSLLTASADGYARLWNSSGALQQEIKTGRGPAKDAEFSPVNDGIYVRTRSEVIGIWSLQGVPIAELRHASEVGGMTVEQDLGRIATWTSDNTIQLWDLKGHPIHRFLGHRDAILSVVFVPRSNLLLSCAKDGTAKLWDTNGNILMDWIIDPTSTTPAMLSPDGLHVLTVDQDKTVSITPLPNFILEQMQAGIDLKGVEMQEWLKKYDVQLFEE